jgi:general secretion pathway protein G
MKRSLRPSTAAFTLLEIMLVVMIIALLAGAAIFSMRGNLDVAKSVRVTADIKNIETQLMVYSTLNGFYPSTSQGLKALVEKPQGEPQPRSWRMLIPEVPVDPWGAEYRYASPGVHNTAKFDLFSSGPDRIPGNADDEGGNWKQ